MKGGERWGEGKKKVTIVNNTERSLLQQSINESTARRARGGQAAGGAVDNWAVSVGASDNTVTARSYQ